MDDVRARTRGRRPAGEDTRGLILAAAREEFAARGYAATSVRGVARRADVDPGTVRHWFADKGELFVASVLPLGVEPARLVGEAVEPGVDGLAERLLTAVLAIWDREDGDLGRSVFSALFSGDEGPRDVAGFPGRHVFARIGEAVGARARPCG